MGVQAYSVVELDDLQLPHENSTDQPQPPDSKAGPSRPKRLVLLKEAKALGAITKSLELSRTFANLASRSRKRC